MSSVIPDSCMRCALSDDSEGTYKTLSKIGKDKSQDNSRQDDKSDEYFHHFSMEMSVQEDFISRSCQCHDIHSFLVEDKKKQKYN